MVTWQKAEIMGESSAGAWTWYKEGACLSTDTKPTGGIFNGSQLVEIDTGDIYLFDEDGGSWVKWGAQ